MGWRFKWVSSYGADFNFDYHVSFTKEEMAKGEVNYNYGMMQFPSEEAPGLSAFYKNRAAKSSTHIRLMPAGSIILLGAYNYLDIAPKGRDEDELAFSMAWVRHHDRYDESEVIDSTQQYVPPAVAKPCCKSEEQHA